MLLSLIEKLKKVKDFRRSQGRRHKLHWVLIIIILGIMLGSTNYKELRQFTKENSQSLIKELNIVEKILPSYATIRRVIIGVNWQNLLNIFREWALEIYPDNEEIDWLAIDGKSLRSTLKNYRNNEQNFVMIVSLFSQKTSLVIDLERIENKQGSEIRAAQELVKSCEYKNKVFTLDALHCNEQLTSEVIEKNNDYLIPVKKNNINLYKQVEDFTKKTKPLSINRKYERSHGREIMRKVSVFENTNIQHKSCQNLKSIIKVERVGFRGSKYYQQRVYYLSSLLNSAEIMAEKIKEHWGIENKLHWVKDVIFQEDNLKISDFQATTNFSILITIAMNFFRSLGFFSIKEGQDWLEKKWYKLLI